jgi:hypothetical protein
LLAILLSITISSISSPSPSLYRGRRSRIDTFLTQWVPHDHQQGIEELALWLSDESAIFPALLSSFLRIFILRPFVVTSYLFSIAFLTLHSPSLLHC